MKKRLFYVFTRGKVYGAFPEESIMQLAREGKLPADVQLSEDGQTWYRPELILPLEVSHFRESQNAPVPPVPPPPPPSTPSREPRQSEAFSQRKIVFILATFFGIAFLIGILVGIAGRMASRHRDSQQVTRSYDTHEIRSKSQEPKPKSPPVEAEKSDAGTASEPKKQPSRPPSSEAEPSSPSESTTGPPVWQEQVQKATVTVLTDEGQGSGFFINGQAGDFLIVTNHHVVKNAQVVQARLHDGTLVRVNRAALYPQFDLAFLMGDELKRPPAVLPLRNELPKAAEKVFAYGAPMGLTGTVTDGIVSGIRTTEELKKTIPMLFEKFEETDWIQTTAPVSPGNSGGPLVDSQGRGVGVNTRGSASEVQNLNFAISSVQVLKLLPNLQIANFPPPRRDAPADDNLADSGRATLKYWKEMHKYWGETQGCFLVLALCVSLYNPELFSPEQQWDLRRRFYYGSKLIIDRFNDLDDSNVDPEAIKCKEAICNLVEIALQFFEVMLENPSPRALRALEAKMKEAHNKLVAVERNAREILSRKYGVEFPPLVGER